MYLRRLEVHGFKAFADRQRFEFGPGLTVIAGPNGSGKSNVADAIRWALGEQSARQIRARKTEDVIFSGSDRRRQMGFAEVTLILDNAEGWMPVEFSEVAVTRRAHRSGDNEYLINGNQVRLADVLDLFRRAQVGQNSYAHMSQGLVDEVLALKPQDRRALIEEAADLRRHRHQLTLSERRLVETRDNLGHVRMLIREVEPRIRTLQRQSRRAARYRELAAALADALQVYFEHELRASRERQAAAQAEHDQRAQAFAVARGEAERLETRLAELQPTLRQRRTALDALQARERELAEEGLRLEQGVALAEQRLELLGERRAELERTIATAEIPEGEDASVDMQIASLDRRVAGAKTQLESDRAALAAADEATRGVLRELGEAEARRARLEAELQDLERRIREEAARAEEAARERVEGTAERATLEQAREDQEAALAAHEREAAGLAEAARMARIRRESTERRLEDVRRDREHAAEALRESEAVVARLQEHQRLIELLQDALPSATGGAQALLEAAHTRSPEGEPLVTGVIDAVARLVRVPEGLEVAIEAALSEHLAAVVVEDYDDAVAALEYLREHEAGTATIYPLRHIEHRYPLNLFNERGVIGIAARLVRCEQKHRPLVDTLLGRVIVVEDLRVAEQMVKRGLGAVVTRDGTLLRQGGSVYGGRAGAAAERFSLERELELLPEQIAEAQAALTPAHQRVQRAEAVVADATDAVALARRAVDQAEEARRSHETQRAGLERRLAEIAAEVRALERRLEAIRNAGDGEAALRERLDPGRAAVAAVAEQIAAIRDRSAAVGTERDAAAEALTSSTQALAALEAERRAVNAQREERIAARRQAVEALRTQREQAAAIRREQEDLELTLRDRRERQANNRAARAEAQGAVGPAHAALAELVEEERELSASRGDAQRALLAAEHEMLESDHALRQHAEHLQRLQHEVAEEGMQILPDGGVRPLPRPALTNGPPPEEAAPEAREAVAPIRGGAEVDLAALRERIAELRSEIRSLGPVNVDAIEDLAEQEERFEFLSAQVSDLEAAEAELREAIRELKRLIRTRFVETFHVVNERFGEYFSRFFGGGQAELRLIQPEEDDEDAEAGVDIFAQPPGKRISNLAVLSGGERSMTSVALLFALLSVNPAPVVVLDEVDAALDEANVGRFVDTLRELRERSQFVVISHNRRTVEAADAIYGISMGDDSTSQVLSLRLADLPKAG